MGTIQTGGTTYGCWMDDEGNLYGATCLKGHDKRDMASVYNNDGSITVSRVNRDHTDVKGANRAVDW